MARRLFLFAIGAVFAALAVWCFINAARIRREFEFCLIDQISLPFRFDVPGTLEADVEASGINGHGQTIYVLLPPSLAERLPADFQSANLAGAVSVYSADGWHSPESSVTGVLMNEIHGRRCIQLWADMLPHTGTYHVEVSLAHPDLTLGSEPGTLVFVNQVCGLELLPAQVLQILGFGSSLVAVPLLGVAGWKLAKFFRTKRR